MPSLATRDTSPEIMDDLTIGDERLTDALDELRLVGRFLGGTSNSIRALAPTLRAVSGRSARVLDVGTGGGDFGIDLVRWGAGQRVQVEVEAVDLNPAAVDYAERIAAAILPPHLKPRLRFDVADALRLPYADATFDAAHAGLFLHHFDDAGAARLLGELKRVARVVVVNDLHRHWLAYRSIDAIARLTNASEMFRADAPHSVARGFTRAELHQLAAEAGLDAEVHWKWAFRWILIGR
jgi:ubiquinone/menaquinone biosynthesis C-methylase UbiE